MPRTEQDLAIVGIIPARYGSTRLPGTPLSEIHGTTPIECVCGRPDRDTPEDLGWARALRAEGKGRVD